MAQPAPGVDRNRRQLVQTVADDVRPAFIEHYRARLDVPLPGADVGTVDDVGEAAALVGQFGFVKLALGDVA